MSLRDLLTAEFDEAMVKTRVVLERVPEAKFGWKPHPKSFTMGALATHLATLPTWIVKTFDCDVLDLMPGGKPPERTVPAATHAELMRRFEDNVREARAALEKVGEERWSEKWSLARNGQVLLTLTRYEVLRSFVLNHTVHHRAQLGVYLRLNDIPVPMTIGSTADEPGGS